MTNIALPLNGVEGCRAAHAPDPPKESFLSAPNRLSPAAVSTPDRDDAPQDGSAFRVKALFSLLLSDLPAHLLMLALVLVALGACSPSNRFVPSGDVGREGR